MLGGLASGRNDGCGRPAQDSSTNFSITTLRAALLASSRALYALTVFLSLLFAFVIVWARECP